MQVSDSVYIVKKTKDDLYFQTIRSLDSLSALNGILHSLSIPPVFMAQNAYICSDSADCGTAVRS